jgi:flavin-dependent dehydrogenase
MFEKLGFQCTRPRTTKAYITEVNLGNEQITKSFGNSMHIFMLNLPRLDCAAIIPKGDFVTVCLLGEDIDRELIDTFFANDAVKGSFPAGWESGEGACHCSPKINIGEAATPFLDRVVLVGDCGVTRLYKDGIGAAYRTAKAAARTAVFSGVSEADFQRHYAPAYRAITRDNRFGSFIFGVVHWIKKLPPLLRGAMSMTEQEQAKQNGSAGMSVVLWDMFTGSAPYREIFFRTVSPRFLVRFGWASARSIKNGRRGKAG